MDTFRRKTDRTGDAGVPINDKMAQWRFYDRISFMKDYIVNRKLVIYCTNTFYFTTHQTAVSINDLS